MKTLIKILGVLQIIGVFAIFSTFVVSFNACEKKQGQFNPNEGKTLSQSTILHLNSSKSEMQDNLRLIARGLTRLMHDSDIKHLVANLAKSNAFEQFVAANIQNNRPANGYAVHLATLIDQCQKVLGRDFKQEICDSLVNNGEATTTELKKMKQIIESFHVDDVTLFPRIYFPALDSLFYTQGHWDGITPCFIAVTQLFPSSEMPVFEIINGQVSENIKSIDDVQAKAAWHINLSHDATETPDIRDFFQIGVVSCTCTPNPESSICAPSNIHDGGSFCGTAPDCGFECTGPVEIHEVIDNSPFPILIEKCKM